MNTTDIFQPENIIFLNDVSTKEMCLKAIAQHATTLELGNDSEAIYNGFMARESECTTGFGDGFAIPHTRCDAVTNIGLIFVKSQLGMEWEAMDEQPVYIAIAILVPQVLAGTIHITLLSSLSRKLMNKEFKQQVKEAVDAADIVAIIRQVLEGT